MEDKYDLMDVTFVIPLRVDSLERFENIMCVVSYLSNCFNTNILILEADIKNNGLLKKNLPTSVDFMFVEDRDAIFHRTKYINILVANSKTDLLAVWDADVVVNPVQLVKAVENLRSKEFDFIYPYDGRYMETGIAYRRKFIETFDINPLEENGNLFVAPYSMIACGGGFLANKQQYIKCGMENENFHGWGPEDAERLNRWLILGYKVGRIEGFMFHLYHPRGRNSYFDSETGKEKLLYELNRIKSMAKDDLLNEVNTWNKVRSEGLKNNPVAQ